MQKQVKPGRLSTGLEHSRGKHCQLGKRFNILQWIWSGGSASTPLNDKSNIG